MKFPRLLLFPVLSLAFAGAALAAETVTPETLPPGEHMYVIERVIPGAGSFTPEKLKSISQTSCSVLNKMGSKIQWLHSYVTGDKVYCVYLAPDEPTIQEHARRVGIPANRVSAVRRLIDPTMAA